MTAPVENRKTVAAICIIAIAIAVAIQDPCQSSESSNTGNGPDDKAGARDHFIARFDSLAGAILYHTVRTSGAFTKAQFDENREQWVLTVNLRDWNRRPEVFRKEIVARLYSGFRTVRARAGGDAALATLIVETEDGEELVTCTSPGPVTSVTPIDLRTKIVLTVIACGLALPILVLLTWRSRRKEIALVLLSLVVSLSIVELALRHFYPQVQEHDKMFEYDENLGWRFIANKRGAISYTVGRPHYIETNSQGFRDGPPPSPGDPKRKILVLGDSFVSNVTIEASKVFTEVLEEWLPDVEVLNFGVNGYGQTQEYLLLKQWLPHIKPGLVVLVISVRTDFDDNAGGYWLYPRPVARCDLSSSTLTIDPPPPPTSPAEQGKAIHERALAFLGKSHVYSLLARRAQILVGRYTQTHDGEYATSLETPPELYLCRVEPSDQTEMLYRTMATLLIAISEYTEEQGVPTLFLVAPSFLQADPQLWTSALVEIGEDIEAYDRTLPDTRLIQLATHNNLSMIDLLPILEAELAQGRPSYNVKQQHWNSHGNHVVAGVLLKYLAESGWHDTQ